MAVLFWSRENDSSPSFFLVSLTTKTFRWDVPWDSYSYIFNRGEVLGLYLGLYESYKNKMHPVSKTCVLAFKSGAYCFSTFHRSRDITVFLCPPFF